MKSPKNDIGQWKQLCIEEPFDLTNTARSVYDIDIFNRIKMVFITSYTKIKETMDLSTIFETCFLPNRMEVVPPQPWHSMASISSQDLTKTTTPPPAESPFKATTL